MYAAAMCTCMKNANSSAPSSNVSTYGGSNASLVITDMTCQHWNYHKIDLKIPTDPRVAFNRTEHKFE